LSFATSNASPTFFLNFSIIKPPFFYFKTNFQKCYESVTIFFYLEVTELQSKPVQLPTINVLTNLL
jgi:hypothetical protein